MSRLIGLLCAWSSEDFIEPCIKQALDNCDELHICISAHTEELLKFADNTHEIALKYKDHPKVKWYRTITRLDHSKIKAFILNNMLQSSDYFQEGNWIWVIDVDEFFHNDFFNILKNKIFIRPEVNKILVEEYFFYINMQHYLEGSHYRFFKIQEENLNQNRKFFPTQNWYQSTPIVITTERNKIPMFHYSMLLNPWMKNTFWKTEYHGEEQSIKTEWLNKVYRHYELNYQNYWTDFNKELFDIKSPWFSDSFKPDKDGKLFSYKGEHPKYISQDLINIQDYRLKYNFK